MARFMTIPEIRQLLNAKDKFFLAEHSIDEGLAYLSQAHNVASDSALDYLAYMKTRNGSSPAYAVERITKTFSTIHFPSERAEPTPKPEPRTVEVSDRTAGRRTGGRGLNKMLVEVQRTTADAAASAASAAEAARLVADRLGAGSGASAAPPPPAREPDRRIVSRLSRPTRPKPEVVLEEIPAPVEVEEVEEVEAEVEEVEAEVEVEEVEAEVEEVEAEVEVEEAEVEVEEAEVEVEEVEEEVEVEEVEPEPAPPPKPKKKPSRTRRTPAAKTGRTRRTKAVTDSKKRPRRRKKAES